MFVFVFVFVFVLVFVHVCVCACLRVQARVRVRERESTRGRERAHERARERERACVLERASGRECKEWVVERAREVARVRKQARIARWALPHFFLPLCYYGKPFVARALGPASRTLCFGEHCVWVANENTEFAIMRTLCVGGCVCG